MKARQKQKFRPPILTVRMAPGSGTRAIVSIGPLAFAAAIGKSGRTIRKREGDGATPIAAMTLLGGYWRSDRLPRPKSALPLAAITPDLVWCDASGHPLYNRPASGPLSASHEKMMRGDHLYDICLVMDWNITSRKRKRGSAIFFHLARPGFTPTEGCIAVRLADMKRILGLVRRGSVVRVL